MERKQKGEPKTTIVFCDGIEHRIPSLRSNHFRFNSERVFGDDPHIVRYHFLAIGKGGYVSPVMKEAEDALYDSGERSFEPVRSLQGVFGERGEFKLWFETYVCNVPALAFERKLMEHFHKLPFGQIRIKEDPVLLREEVDSVSLTKGVYTSDVLPDKIRKYYGLSGLRFRAAGDYIAHQNRRPSWP